MATATRKPRKRKTSPLRYTCQYTNCPHGENGSPKRFPGRNGKSNKYCCQQCYWAAKTGQKMTTKRDKHITYKTCRNPACRKSFIANRTNRLYCSIRCAAQARGDLLRNKPRARHTRPSEPILVA